MMRGTDKERPDRWRDDDRRGGAHAEGAQTADDDRRIHGVNATTACLLNSLIVALDEIGPVALIRVGDDGGGETIALQRNCDAEIEFIVLDDAIVFQHDAS